MNFKNISAPPLTALAFSLLFIPPIDIAAQENKENTEIAQSRFFLERDGDGFIRMDKQTGETSYCKSNNGNLVCRLAIEERDGFHDEITNLQSEVTALNEKLAARSLDEKSGEQLRPKTRVPGGKNEHTHHEDMDKFEQELDKAMEITKRAMRKLFKTAKELKKEFEERNSY